MPVKNYVPQLGNFDDLAIELQFGATRLDGISCRTTPIEILSYGPEPSVVSHATGFFWEDAGRQYIITNRHVVTGRNGFTDDYITQELMQPHRIRYFEIKWHKLEGNYWHLERLPVELELFENGKAMFLEHRNFSKYRIDIVAIPLKKNMHSLGKFSPFLNHFKFESLFHMTGDTCCVVGYPFRNYTGNMIPIWKNGTLASEPMFPVDNKPMFLLDTLTKDGMSGSPVFRRVFGPATAGDLEMHVDSVVRTEFVGVYSGRMSSPEFVQAGLGIAWYANLIPQILATGIAPTFEGVHARG